MARAMKFRVALGHIKAKGWCKGNRHLPVDGEKLVVEIEAAWAQRRLLVMRLIARHELTLAQIIQMAEVSRQTVFTYRVTLVA